MWTGFVIGGVKFVRVRNSCRVSGFRLERIKNLRVFYEWGIDCEPMDARH
jgi:hypothetical protein